MEVIEEDIINGKTRERVQKGRKQRRIRVLRVAVQINIGREGGAGEFQNKERPHQVLQPLAGERNRDPEERAAEQIERIGADEIDAEVGQVVPADVALADGVMRKPVKRDLLHIEIAVKNEAPAIHQNEGEENDKRQR